MTNNRFDREGRTSRKKKSSPLTVAVSVIFLAIGGITSCIDEAGSCSRQRDYENNSGWSLDDYDFGYDFDIANTNSEKLYPKLRITKAVLYQDTNILSVVMENYGNYAQTYFPFIAAQVGDKEDEGYLFSVQPTPYYGDAVSAVNDSISYRTVVPSHSEITLTCNLEEYQTEKCLEAVSDTDEVFITIFSDTAENVYCKLEFME